MSGRRKIPGPPSGDRRRSGGRRTSHGNVREAAAFVVERTLRTRSMTDAFMANALARCDARDHALLNELVMGTLRWLRRLDHLIATAANRPFHEIEEPLHNPLRLAAYQLFFLDRVPDHAIVHEAVDQAGRATHRGGASFANAVLRRLARDKNLDAWPVEEEDPIRRLAIETSHPDFLVERYVERLGTAKTQILLHNNNRPKHLHLLSFRDRGGREAAAEQLIDQGVAVEPSVLAPCGLVVREGDPVACELFRQGDLYIQDEASQIAALVPPPVEGETVLDLAAAPGGKSLSLIAYQPDLRPVLADVSLARLLRARSNLLRLGRDLPLVVDDASNPAISSAAASFDRVVIDLPCSGTGTFRKNPELKWRLTPGEIGRLSGQSRQLLDRAAERVATGGLLLAITCSIEEEENEQVSADFMAAHPNFEWVEEAKLLPCHRDVGELRDGFWRLFPEADHDGFTVQAMRRCR